MATLIEKLRLKNCRQIVVLDAPESLAPELARLPVLHLHHHLASAQRPEFILAFVTRKAQVDALAPRIAAHIPGDVPIWFAYPKGTSKNYTCDFNRDTGWDALRGVGFETVRAIAIDEDWTALRFRRREYIKARSKTGQSR